METTKVIHWQPSYRPIESIDFAVNGQEALEKRRLNDYDLILMDIQVPIMDGYAATREIRRLGKGEWYATRADRGTDCPCPERVVRRQHQRRL